MISIKDRRHPHDSVLQNITKNNHQSWIRWEYLLWTVSNSGVAQASTSKGSRTGGCPKKLFGKKNGSRRERLVDRHLVMVLLSNVVSDDHSLSWIFAVTTVSSSVRLWMKRMISYRNSIYNRPWNAACNPLWILADGTTPWLTAGAAKGQDTWRECSCFRVNRISL